jgi:hypothetical protein
MGQGSAETVKEIEETRGRLESDLRELEQRLPAPAVWAKRAVGLAAGGGVAGSMFWFGVRRVRKRREKKAAAERAQQAVLQVVPDEWAKAVSKALESGEWKGWLTIAGGAWLVLRLAELRQLRRTNKLILATAARQG